MNKKKVSYNTQVQFAIMAGKSDEAHDIIGRVLAEMVNGALEFAQSYPFDDLPFVIVAMKVAVNALESMLGPNGKALADTIYSRTDSMSLMPPSSSVRRKVVTAMADRNTVYDLLPEDELLTQLAEECSEAAKAALKLRRVRNGANPTPVSEEEAFGNLVEELADIYLCSIVLFGGELDDDDPCNMCDDVGDNMVEIMEQKLARWKYRLMKKEAPNVPEE